GVASVRAGRERRPPRGAHSPRAAAARAAHPRVGAVTLEPHGDRLRARPAAAVTASDAEAIRRHKTEILALLRAEHVVSVPPPDAATVREVLGPAPTDAALAAVRHELACALWDLRERQASRNPLGGANLVRGRVLADWLRLEGMAGIRRESRQWAS